MRKSLITLAALASLSVTAQAAVLHNNGEVTNGLGLSVVAAGNFYTGYTGNSNAALADDFTVGAGKRWNVQSLDFFAYQTNATDFTFSQVTWSVVQGDVNTGSVVASGTTAVSSGGLMGYRVAASDPTNTLRPIFRIQADMADFSLLAGSYWLTWHLAGDSRLTGPWVPATSDGATGNAMQKFFSDPSPTFMALVDGIPAQGVNLPFLVNGVQEDVVRPPVPEPETYALMLLGLAGVGAVARRRRA